MTNNNCYLLIDLEATCCDDGSIDRRAMEIIEIGAVMVERDSLITVDEFQAFIRPVRHPQLTAFCTQLTSIRQEDVDLASDYPTVLAVFREWIYRHHVTAWGSWGNYDYRQFDVDCGYHHQPWPFGFEHTNFKKVFTDRHRLKKRVGLRTAVTMAGLSFIGINHRGIDDARNIVQLMPLLVGDAQLPADIPRKGPPRAPADPV